MAIAVETDVGRPAPPAGPREAVIETLVEGHDGTRLFVSTREGRGASGLTTFLCDGILCDGYIWRYFRDEAEAAGGVVEAIGGILGAILE